MRIFLKLLISVLMLFTGVFLTYRVTKGYKEKKESEIRIQNLPDAQFVSLHGIWVNLLDFDHSKPLVIVYFHPECDYCATEAQEIGLNASGFEQCQVVMITPDDSLQRLESFCDSFNLWEVNNIEILIDSDNQFKKIFGKTVLPSVYIYNTNRQLKKKFPGETRLEAIFAEIQDD